MKLIAVPALLRFSVPDDTPQEVIDDLVQSLVSDTIPTVEDNDEMTHQVKEHAREYVLETTSADHIDWIEDVNIWVNSGPVEIHDI